MYTLSKFESEEAARSQAELLQIQPRLLLGHRNCSNVWRKCMSWGPSMNRRYDKHGWYNCNRPEHGSSLCNSQSDPQCFELATTLSEKSLELVTGACASVASCLNTIGRNVACFKRLLADEFDRVACCRAHCFWLCQPSRQKSFYNFWKLSHRRPWRPRSSRSWICRG